MSIKQKAESQLNWVEKILHFLPGFKGYYQRELRRDADKMEREFLARTIQQLATKVSSQSDAILRMKDFELLTLLNNVITTMTTLVSQIQYAERGYSGFFDLIKIKEAELDRVYEYDLQMLETVNQLENLTQNFINEPTVINLKAIEQNLKSLQDYFNQRLNILRDLK